MHELAVKERTTLGTKAVESLRKEGYIPAVAYGKGKKTLPLTISMRDFKRMFKQTGETAILTLKGAGADVDALIHEVSFHPVSGEPLHVDFYVVDKDIKVRVNVPIEFVGVSGAAKELGARIVKVLHELEIEALPHRIPQNLEVDVSALSDLGSQILVRDISLPDGVETFTNVEDVVALAEEAVEEEEAEITQEGPDFDSIEVEQKGKGEDESSTPDEGEVKSAEKKE
jgi:large subunit ribosomal protein L25